MFRQSLLFLSDSPALRRVVTETQALRSLAERFVAGETLDEAMRVAATVNGAGMTVTLDYLGELVASREDALSATDMAIRTLERIASDAIDGNVSLKPTQLGLEIDRDFCLENIERILQRARELGNGDTELFVRLDMEASAYTEDTVALVETLWERGYRNVGTAVQSYLKRALDDVRRLNELGSRVRLVKGAYNEPAEVAFTDKREVDRTFLEAMELLLREGTYPAIATHDEEIISRTRRYAFEHGIPRDSYEFQMLYGIRRDLQQRLLEEGYNVRVYIPFGQSWYPYLMRRMAERPANFFFVAGSVIRESPVRWAARPFAIGAGLVAGAIATSAWRGRRNSG
jgi:proline dehydrogenase